MPRFHFHLIDGERMLDSVGRQLPSQDEARKEAKRMAKCHAALRERWHYVEVTDEAGERILRVPLKDETPQD